MIRKLAITLAVATAPVAGLASPASAQAYGRVALSFGSGGYRDYDGDARDRRYDSYDDRRYYDNDDRGYAWRSHERHEQVERWRHEQERRRHREHERRGHENWRDRYDDD